MIERAGFKGDLHQILFSRSLLLAFDSLNGGDAIVGNLEESVTLFDCVAFETSENSSGQHYS